MIRINNIFKLLKPEILLLYSGAQPEDVDTKPCGTLIAICKFDKRYKAWLGPCKNSGSIGWFRLYFSDKQNIINKLIWIDGSVGTKGNNLNLPNVTYDKE